MSPRAVVSWSLVLGVVLAAAGTTSTAAVPPAETLVPATTKGFVAIADIRQLVERWNNTPLGKLLQDPAMKPFLDDLEQKLEQRRTSLQERLGITFDDLRNVPGGECALAVVAPAGGQFAVVLLVDVTGHRPQADAMLQKLTTHLKQRGATAEPAARSDPPIHVLRLPADENRDKPATVAYFLDQQLLAMSDRVDVLQEVLARRLGNAGPTLAEDEAYRAVMARCSLDAKGQRPQIRWFIEPFGYAEALSAARPKQEGPPQKTMLDHLKATGFTAVRGIGGFVEVDVEQFQILHRTAVFAPRPYEKSMNLLTFPNTVESALPSWIPRNLAGLIALSYDVRTAFASIGPLYDEIVGAEDVWLDVLDSLKTDPYGPQIDLTEELINHLGTRVFVLTEYKEPLTTTSERLLIAIETRNPRQVAAALKKTMQNDKEVRRREHKGYVIWETIPAESPRVERVRIEIPSSRAPGKSRPPFGPRVEEEAAESERTPLFPNASMTVSDGYLLVASHYEYLLEFLDPPEQPEPLSEAIDYAIVDTLLQELCGKEGCLRVFYRADRMYRPTYELIRQGKMPESETLLGRLLNTMLPGGEEGHLRKQQIDGSKLPDFEVVRRHLGPVGLFGRTEEQGWFLKGFMLRQGTP